MATEEELFAYATLKLQDPAKASRMTFSDTRQLFGHLRGLHGEYIQFLEKDIICDAHDEDLTPISEILGIACGVASIVAAMSVNPNRIIRIRTGGKRLDFQFWVGGKLCHLECKGTTYTSKLKGMLRASKTKKVKTRVRYDAGFGALTIYATPSRSNPTRVIIVDPPPGKTARSSPPVREEATLIRYYLPYLQAVLSVNSFTEWVMRCLQTFENGDEPSGHASAPPLPRVVESFEIHGRFFGTIFDARFMNAALLRFADFDAATEALGSLSTFIGVHEDVLRCLEGADWEGLRNLAWTPELREDAALLASGVLTRTIAFRGGDEQTLRNNFAVARGDLLRVTGRSIE